ncbi:DUF397 domain-containing protein [Streptomyces sp. NPDC056637]|uniref:DUF397 domain-containing protein n=1 Tax=Streptomyces sp. NPDC056637 TaxID=3345886 RepID=UPI0036BC8970
MVETSSTAPISFIPSRLGVAPVSYSRLEWSKSSCSRSEPSGCVEVAATSIAVHIRDSKASRKPHLVVSPVARSVFVAAR